jgi:predicted acyl esterase
MARAAVGILLDQIRKSAGRCGLSDAGLLERFVLHRDEAAFELLIDRFGPMVLGLCRRVLGDAHAAEDAFQATFLVLARKAPSLVRQELVQGTLPVQTQAQHYLLIGPYDHFGVQRFRKDPVLRAYTIDPVAQFDTSEITFQWLDHVLQGGNRPDLVTDRINYEVMGANEWKHAPSIEKMANDVLTLYLTDTKDGDRYQMSEKKPAGAGALHQEVDFADRKTSNNDYYPFPIVGKKPDLSNGFCFLSAPFQSAVCVSGPFSGDIRARINKKDMDVGVTLYEQMPSGELFHLSYFVGRASYARDMSVRQLLTPGKVEAIRFSKTRMVSRKLTKGSRLLVTLNINKNPFAQVNYGSGKDVSDEDINDAKIPLQVDWQNDSYVRIPVWKSE